MSIAKLRLVKRKGEFAKLIAEMTAEDERRMTDSLRRLDKPITEKTNGLSKQ